MSEPTPAGQTGAVSEATGGPAQRWPGLAQPSVELLLPRAARQSTRDPDVHLVADGATIRPVATNGGIYSFVVPRDVRSVSLASRSSSQTSVGPPRGADIRGIGVRVTDIEIRSNSGRMVIPIDDPRLTEGWYDAEQEGIAIWRWTDGAAKLPWTNVAGPVVVTIRCFPLAEYVIQEGNSGPVSMTLDNLTLQWDSGAGAQPFASGVMVNQLPPDADKPLQLQWCVGMYSSGSTWAFNAIRGVADLLVPGVPHIGIYAETLDEFPPGWTTSDRLIVKSHHSDERTTALLTRCADHIWISVRDPRDAVASASTYMYPNFEIALTAVTRSALHCERFIDDPRCTLLRYEDGFIDDPATLDRFAAAFSRTLTPADRDLLFQQTRRRAIETMIREFAPNETVDDGYRGRVHLGTQWHSHHANRTGEVGRWRHTLDAGQVEEIERRLGPWMERFGYRS